MTGGKRVGCGTWSCYPRHSRCSPMLPSTETISGNRNEVSVTASLFCGELLDRQDSPLHTAGLLTLSTKQGLSDLLRLAGEEHDHKGVQ